MKQTIIAVTALFLTTTNTTGETLKPSIYRAAPDQGTPHLIPPSEYRGTANSAHMNRCEYFGKFAEDVHKRHQNGEAGSSILGTVLDFEMDTGGPSKDSYILREIALFATGPKEPQNGYLLTVFMRCVDQGW